MRSIYLPTDLLNYLFRFQENVKYTVSSPVLLNLMPLQMVLNKKKQTQDIWIPGIFSRPYYQFTVKFKENHKWYEFDFSDIGCFVYLWHDYILEEMHRSRDLQKWGQMTWER